MTDSQELHEQAMELAEQADRERLVGNTSTYQSLLGRAYSLEKKAALLLRSEEDLEPTRSILLRSAASLAIECEKTREAEQLVAIALSGNPPEEVADDLRDIAGKLRFEQKLKENLISLGRTEINVSFDGPEIGPGIAPSRTFIDRLQDLKTLTTRSLERIMGRPFREAGRVPKEVVDAFDFFISEPIAGSFMVKLQLGKVQMAFPGMDDWAERLTEDILECLKLYGLGDFKELHARIGDDIYFKNFRELVRRIGPDGHDVTSVGIAGYLVEKQQDYQVILPVPVSETEIADEIPKRQRVEISGVLNFADASKKKAGIIHLVTDCGETHTIHVDPSIMTDIVKPLFGEEVRIIGEQRARWIELHSIQEDTE